MWHHVLDQCSQLRLPDSRALTQPLLLPNPLLASCCVAASVPAAPLFSILPDHDNIARVVAAIRAGQLAKRDDEHLQLPEGVYWPVGNNRSNILYVRKYYRPLFHSVLKKCLPHEADPDCRRIVTGQPGIGKSFWA